ncbi:MAG: ribosome assembly RNA-binding protein YhbY [Porticoccaceae bacterium]|nr:ribosome assembly RNA-binding protein YhbY [Porticoccaceae bacterium]
MTTSSADKKYLRSLGHSLKPVVTVAGNGLTETVLAELDRALSDHELIKVKLAVGDRDAKKATIDEICQQSKSQLIQSIGHMILLFRKADKPNPKLSNLLRQ